MEDYVNYEKRQRSFHRLFCSILFAFCIMCASAAIVGMYFLAERFGEWSPAPDPGDQPETAPHFDMFKNVSKGLQVFSHSKADIKGEPAWQQLIKNESYAFDRLVEYCVFNGYTEVSLFGGTITEHKAQIQKGELPMHIDLVECLTKMQYKKIKVNLVYYINNDVNDFTDYELVDQLSKTVKSINSSIRINSIIFDQQPSDVSQYETLVKMLLLSVKNFATGGTIKPLWLNHTITADNFTDAEIVQLINGNNAVSTFADLLIHASNRSELMIQSNNWTAIGETSAQFKNAASKFGSNNSYIALEVGNAAPGETLGESIRIGYDSFYENFARFATSYKTVSLHDYRQLFDIFYCTEPVQWKKLQTRVNCSAESVDNSTPPDISYD